MLFEHFASAEAKVKTLCGWCSKLLVKFQIKILKNS